MNKSGIKLTREQQEMLNGAFGKAAASALEALIIYGDARGAKRLIPVTYAGAYISSPADSQGLSELLMSMRSLISEGAQAHGSVTSSPGAIEGRLISVEPGWLLNFDKLTLSARREYSALIKEINMSRDAAASCDLTSVAAASYPKRGDVLSWAHSGSSVYANSVLGARCACNTPKAAMLGAIAGFVPELDCLTDEGRAARFIIKLKVSALPDAALLGSVIGEKTKGAVAYIYGLDALTADEPEGTLPAYLKDLSQALALYGAGMFHADGVTPEAKEEGAKLIAAGAEEFTVTDDILSERAKSFIPDEPKRRPDLCLIGCPHMSYDQLVDWTNRVVYQLRVKNRNRVVTRTLVSASPDVAARFKKAAKYLEFKATGAVLETGCPLVNTGGSAAAGKRRILTNSEKLRFCAGAEFHTTDELVDMITGTAKKF